MLPEPAMFGVAARAVDEPTLAAWLRDHVRFVPSPST